jgi:YebC/PmpR family DNA-binding regulatory protein
MAGHSKWANIQHRKGRQDKLRAKIFSKLSKEITVAAKMGDPDPDKNPRLRLRGQGREIAVHAQGQHREARSRRRVGGEGDDYEEIRYEGYGPNGVAVIVEAMTDNRNRTASNVRSTFTKNGGNLGETGCVSYNFTAQGFIEIDESQGDEDKLTEVAIESGGEDVVLDDGTWIITTAATDLLTVRQAIEEAGVEVRGAEVRMVPTTTVEVSGDAAKKTLRMVETLEEQDDVQHVWSNFEIPDAELAALEAEMG